MKEITMLEMIDKLGGHRKTIAESAGMTEQGLNNLVSQRRTVIEVDGGFILKTSKTKIFKSAKNESK